MRILKTPPDLLLKRREYTRKWRNKHPEKAAIYEKRYRGRYAHKIKTWRIANRERSAWYSLKRKYGLTPEAYADLLHLQQGLCGICSTPASERKLVVDHDHADGRVRGLLCHACNSMLATLENENFKRLAAKYTSGVKFIFPLPTLEIV